MVVYPLPPPGRRHVDSGGAPSVNTWRGLPRTPDSRADVSGGPGTRCTPVKSTTKKEIDRMDTNLVENEKTFSEEIMRDLHMKTK